MITPSDMEIIICGKPKIDIDDWERNTRYIGSLGGRKHKEWFWKIVREDLSEEERV